VALDFRQSPVRACGLRLENGHLLTTPMLITPARVGMLLTADTPGTYEIPIYSPSESSIVNSQLSIVNSPSEAAGNELVGVLEDTRVPWISADDSARNYILQPQGWRRANGAFLRGGKAYLHTDGNGTEDIDAAFDQLLDQELEHFRLNDSPSFFHLPSYIYFLLGVAIYLLVWWVLRKRREQRK